MYAETNDTLRARLAILGTAVVQSEVARGGYVFLELDTFGIFIDCF
jgi:hypothetical protein